MNNIRWTILLGCVVIVIFDTLTALISVSTGISYELFGIGSLLIYLLFGFLTAAKSKWFLGGLTGAVLGLVDSTIGWAISWNIGPGRPEIEINAILIGATIVFAVVSSAAVGLIGGAISLLRRKDA